MANPLNLQNTLNDRGQRAVQKSERQFRRGEVLARKFIHSQDQGNSTIPAGSALRTLARNSQEPEEIPSNQSREVDMDQAPAETPDRRTFRRSQEQESVSEKQNIGFTSSFLMIGTALFVDTFQVLLSIIPVLGQIMSDLFSLMALLGFAFWFYLHGVKFNRPGKILRFGGSAVIELIPFLHMLPAWTLAVCLTLAYEKKLSQKKGSLSQAVLSRIPI